MRIKAVFAGLILSIGLVVSMPWPAFAEVPKIIAGKNGEMEVLFRNNCVVYFNVKGRIASKQPVCTGPQVNQARDAAARYRREQGLGGNVVADHNDPKARMRVCCQRQSKDWFTTRELCRGLNGIEVPNVVCRSDEDNRPWTMVPADRQRVCCARGAHDWLTSRAECRHSDGLEVPRAVCRDDRDNSSWWHAHRGEDYDNFDDRPAAGFYTSKADVVLACYGEGDKPVLENWDDKTWVAQRQQFQAAVMIELYRSGSGYTGRIHPSGRLLPPLHSGDKQGWWDLKEVLVTGQEMSARYAINVLNKPALHFDRRTGLIAIDGIESFYGRCWTGP